MVSQLSFESPQEAEAFLVEYEIAVFKRTAVAPADPGDKVVQSDAISAQLAVALAKFTKADAKGL